MYLTPKNMFIHSFIYSVDFLKDRDIFVTVFVMYLQKRNVSQTYTAQLLITPVRNK